MTAVVDTFELKQTFCMLKSVVLVRSNSVDGKLCALDQMLGCPFLYYTISNSFFITPGHPHINEVLESITRPHRSLLFIEEHQCSVRQRCC